MSIHLRNRGLRCFVVIVLLGAMVGGFALCAFAAGQQEGPSRFRQIWDISWRVLNFLILAFFLVKYLKQPLTRFFQESARVISETLQGSEQACLDAEKELAEVERRLESLDKEIRKLKDNISGQGERARDKIIESAQITANQMLEKAKLEAAYSVQEAKNLLRCEVIEEAVKIAEENILAAIQVSDQERLVEEYLKDLKQMPGLQA